MAARDLVLLMDDAAFESWYRRERPSLVRAIWAMCGDLDLATDVVDEAFSRALARRSRLASMESPGGWVRTVAVNLLRRAMRRRALEVRLLRRDRSAPSFESATPDPELWAAVRGLPPRQREVIVLRYVLDCTESETAAALGISEGAASANLVKARRGLASRLAVDEEEVALP